ncbi:hypothetical protein BB560_006222 [Smittium megazygosporum]|uniref:Uncharacterized protein n=1 Tax=Smittium megazygosporum TaxID=133381 RepID=A0A2T9YD41_9FUNG|nr:hypothetical protein BB560_006222 [Smittium megazygosporum]
MKYAKKVNFWSDSGPHFKNGNVIYSFLVDFRQNFTDKKIGINFFNEKHGKSDVDGHFGVLSRWYKDLEAIRNISSIIDIKECFEEKERDRNLFESSSAEKNKFSFAIYPRNMPRTERKRILVKDGIKLYQSYYMDGRVLKGSVIGRLDASNYLPVSYSRDCLGDIMGPASKKVQDTRIRMLRQSGIGFGSG